jgi:hypothetical protein
MQVQSPAAETRGCPARYEMKVSKHKSKLHLSAPPPIHDLPKNAEAAARCQYGHDALAAQQP